MKHLWSPYNHRLMVYFTLDCFHNSILCLVFGLGFFDLGNTKFKWVSALPFFWLTFDALSCITETNASWAPEYRESRYRT